jgi:hypothetical protein
MKFPKSNNKLATSPIGWVAQLASGVNNIAVNVIGVADTGAAMAEATKPAE